MRQETNRKRVSNRRRRWQAPIVFMSGLFLMVPLMAPFGLPALQDQPNNTPKPPVPATSNSQTTEPNAVRLPTAAEARARARLLHSAFRGVLQVMHRDFFDPDDRNRIPSSSLEDVFDELAKSQGVEVRWLGVNAKTMNVEHEPRDDFEKNAVKSLSTGGQEYEEIKNGVYRRVGSIRLHNVCLKCHVPRRTSLKDRAAGLVISMPIREK